MKEIFSYYELCADLTECLRDYSVDESNNSALRLKVIGQIVDDARTFEEEHPYASLMGGMAYAVTHPSKWREARTKFDLYLEVKKKDDDVRQQIIRVVSELEPEIDYNYFLCRLTE